MVMDRTCDDAEYFSGCGEKFENLDERDPVSINFLIDVDIWSIKSGELKLERPCLSFDRVFLPIVILFEEESS